MTTTTTHSTTMFKAYIINNTGGQVSSESVIIIPCDPPKDGQPESDFMEDTASYVTKAARQYLNNNPLGTDKDSFSLQELEDVSVASEAGAIVCAFGISAEASLNLVKSAETLVAGANCSKLSPTKRGPLVMFLDARIWKDLTDIWNLDTDIGCKINLFSGKTCLPLSRFKIALQRLVNDDSTGAMKRTAFWRCIAESQAPSGSTGPSYTYESGGSNALLKMSGPPASDPLLSVPRSMPYVKLEPTDQYDRNSRFNGSETSDSAEEGNHGS